MSAMHGVIAELDYEERQERRREERRHGNHYRKPQYVSDGEAATGAVMFAVAFGLGGPLAAAIIAMIGQWISGGK